MIILQHIQTEWTKLSRGYPQSIERNRTPETLELPRPTSSVDIYLHQVTYKEENSFSPESDVIINPNKDVRSKLAILFRKFEKNLVFNFCWSWRYVGAPERRSIEIFSLSEGQSGQIKFNGRFGAQSTTGQDWIYRKNVINVFYGSPSGNHIFWKDFPNKHYESIENLK
ncbi:MAG: hypothetical protein P8L44_24030 [Opitutales bacterium]|jgi:hypothetical protein|nr:hypothetical protein [Opitutales bacterium]